MDRAEKTIGAFYFLAFLALAGLLVPIKWPKAGAPLTRSGSSQINSAIKRLIASQ